MFTWLLLHSCSDDTHIMVSQVTVTASWAPRQRTPHSPKAQSKQEWNAICFSKWTPTPWSCFLLSMVRCYVIRFCAQHMLVALIRHAAFSFIRGPSSEVTWIIADSRYLLQSGLPEVRSLQLLPNVALQLASIFLSFTGLLIRSMLHFACLQSKNK